MSDPAVTFAVADGHVDVTLADGTTARLPVGVATLATGDLARRDPPAPDDLTNALGLVADHVDDLLLAVPEVAGHVIEGPVVLAGAGPLVIAQVELGRDDVAVPFELTRAAAEDVFRTVATEARADRAHNPGLPLDHVDSVVAACCVVLGIMRRLELGAVLVTGAPA